MAIWNNRRENIKQIIADAVAEELAKSPALPAGANTTNFSPAQLAGLASQYYGTGVASPLMRNPLLQGVPFGPSNPLLPSAINPVREDGRANPRRWEYPVAWNIQVTEQRLVPWRTLRTAADQIDILRRCIEVIKNKIAGMDWDISLSEDASEQIAAQSGGDHIRAMQTARDSFTEDISRLRKFWENPDRTNGLSFTDWLNMALEELLVLDALAVYPHPEIGGALHSLEILDGSTVKPLLDDRGMRPVAPFPAYQQILYGFPRGEFTANDDLSDDGEFTADDLIYLVRNRRTHTPYGYSPTERSLPLADIYLRRQQWLRAEFTDGVMPETWFTSDAEFGSNPELLRAWENILNDDLAGQTEQRKRGRILPTGLTPVDNTGFSEKFKSDLDEYLVKGICGHFGVMPSEIGFTPNSGLGGGGHQAGESESGSTIGIAPIISWLESVLSDISYRFLGMPRELCFQFSGGRISEQETDAKRRDVELRGGQRTINENRSQLGLPLLDSAEADTPLIVAGNTLYLVTDSGIVDVSTAASTGQNVTPTSRVADGGNNAQAAQVEEQAATPVEELETEQVAEVKAFLKFAKKSPTRDFKFSTLDFPTASALNRAAREGDLEVCKSLASVVLGKG